MSSWLGGVQWGSLSGQISSFAKEVLTEAEEEVQGIYINFIYLPAAVS